MIFFALDPFHLISLTSEQKYLRISGWRMKSPFGSFPKICMHLYVYICASYKVGSTIDLKMFCLKWIISEIHCLLSWVRAGGLPATSQQALMETTWARTHHKPALDNASENSKAQTLKPNSKAQSIWDFSLPYKRLGSLCTQELGEIWQRAENSRWEAREGAGTLHTNPLNHRWSSHTTSHRLCPQNQSFWRCLLG